MNTEPEGRIILDTATYIRYGTDAASAHFAYNPRTGAFDIGEDAINPPSPILPPERQARYLASHLEKLNRLRDESTHPSVIARLERQIEEAHIRQEIHITDKAHALPLYERWLELVNYSINDIGDAIEEHRQATDRKPDDMKRAHGWNQRIKRFTKTLNELHDRRHYIANHIASITTGISDQ